MPDELLSLDNVVLFPHLGSASRETRVAMGMRVVENLEAFFNDKRPAIALCEISTEIHL